MNVPKSQTWPTPKSRSVGLFTDLRLFYEALELTSEQEIINHKILEEELPHRLRGLLSVNRQSSTAVEHLIRELRMFGWIMPTNNSGRPTENINYRLLPSGEEARKLFKKNEQDFLRLLTTKMQESYIIPAWFVHRLWDINPERQGEIVIPTPLGDWEPKARGWEDKSWTKDLSEQSTKTIKIIESVCPGAFPINSGVWIELVKYAWDRLSNLERRKVSKMPKGAESLEKIKVQTYAPRNRLVLAMREAAIKFLFSSRVPNKTIDDFFMSKSPMAPRTYLAWCRRLEALELIFYTDVQPLVPGRLIFPTSIFRTQADTKNFERIGYIRDPQGRFLWLHRPKWQNMKDDFLRVLNQEHKRVSSRIGSLYVSMLDVRDEVCRQLRISASNFDEFMEKALRESVLPNSKWSISVETDIREDQMGGSQLLRRPVWIDGTPHSLIAITESRN